MSIENLQIVKIYSEKDECPFTIKQLVENSFVLKGFRYREVWPHTTWMIAEIKVERPFEMLDRKHLELREMRRRWLSQAGIGGDNHQTFLVGFRGIGISKLYWVMFHDGSIIIGTEARCERW